MSSCQRLVDRFCKFNIRYYGNTVLGRFSPDHVLVPQDLLRCNVSVARGYVDYEFDILVDDTVDDGRLLTLSDFVERPAFYPVVPELFSRGRCCGEPVSTGCKHYCVWETLVPRLRLRHLDPVARLWTIVIAGNLWFD